MNRHVTYALSHSFTSHIVTHYNSVSRTIDCSKPVGGIDDTIQHTAQYTIQSKSNITRFGEFTLNKSRSGGGDGSISNNSNKNNKSPNFSMCTIILLVCYLLIEYMFYCINYVCVCVCRYTYLIIRFLHLLPPVIVNCCAAIIIYLLF